MEQWFKNNKHVHIVAHSIRDRNYEALRGLLFPNLALGIRVSLDERRLLLGQMRSGEVDIHVSLPCPASRYAFSSWDLIPMLCFSRAFFDDGCRRTNVSLTKEAVLLVHNSLLSKFFIILSVQRNHLVDILRNDLPHVSDLTMAQPVLIPPRLQKALLPVGGTRPGADRVNGHSAK